MCVCLMTMCGTYEWKEGWPDWSLRRHVDDDDDDDAEEEDDDDAVVALYPLLIPADQNNNNMLLFSGAKKKQKGRRRIEMMGEREKDRLSVLDGEEAAPLLHEIQKKDDFLSLLIRCSRLNGFSFSRCKRCMREVYGFTDEENARKKQQK